LRTLPEARLVNLRVWFSRKECTNELVTTEKIYSIERNKMIKEPERAWEDAVVVYLKAVYFTSA
jgi:hypothetical protein